MAQLVEIVRQELERYVDPSSNFKSCTVFDDNRRTYAAVSVLDATTPFEVGRIAIVRLEDDWVVIEADNMKRPLVDALTQAGIPREKIVLAYAGENIPATTTVK